MLQVIDAYVIGAAANLIDVRIKSCSLGCF